MKGTTIIMIAYNQKAAVELCINTLRSLGDLEEFTVILVDNASKDGLCDWANMQQDITFVYMDEGYTSYSIILNQLIAELSIEDDILLLDPQVMLIPTSLSKLRKALYEDTETAAVIPLSIRSKSLQGIMSTPEYDAVVLLNQSEENLKMRRTQTMELDDRVVMFKAEVMKQIGPFDETLFIPKSVLFDYEFRAIKAGFKFYICNNAFVLTGAAENHLNLQNNQHKDQETLFKKWEMKYFNVQPNKKLLSFLFEEGDRPLTVLEIGCDCGANLLEIKNCLPQAELYGVEINKSAAEIAKTFAKVMVANVEDKNISLPHCHFDYIVFGDVLEHLRNPEETVGYCRKFLKEGGKILASIPNLMHISVMERLLQGRFTYGDFGILDKTHVHMFTFYEIYDMFVRQNFSIEKSDGIFINMTERQENLIKQLLLLEPAAQAFMYNIYQFIVEAQMNPDHNEDA